MMLFAYIALANAMAQLQAEMAFEKAIATLPFDVARDMRKERAAEQAARRDEETVERRHRETCEALRSISFWRFGRN